MKGKMRLAVDERHVHDAVPLRHQGIEEISDKRITNVPTELSQVNHFSFGEGHGSIGHAAAHCVGRAVQVKVAVEESAQTGDTRN